MFLAASAFAVAGFVLSWFIRELPLRETVATGDLGDTYATPRDADSLAELVNKLGRLDRREGAREIVARVAARAGVELSPAACWLLARLSEAHAPALPTLAAQFEIDLDTLTAAREELAHKHLLIEPLPNGDPSACGAHRRGPRDARAPDRDGRTAPLGPTGGLAAGGARGARPHDRHAGAAVLHRRLQPVRAGRGGDQVR